MRLMGRMGLIFGAKLLKKIGFIATQTLFLRLPKLDGRYQKKRNLWSGLASISYAYNEKAAWQAD